MVAGVLSLIALAGALALFAIGAALGFGASNLVKRLLGVAIAQSGGALAALAIGAPHIFAVAQIAALIATLVLGAAIAVRMQEEYGAVESVALDAADDEADRSEDAR